MAIDRIESRAELTSTLETCELDVIGVQEMELKVATGHFEDKREAILEISDAGWWPVSWRDAPGDVYEAHEHDVDQTLYMVEGHIEIGVDGQPLHLNAGDKLELPAFTVHSARAPEGATCIVGMPKVDLPSEHAIPPDAWASASYPS
jgi:mannose-6-phosphate isomerase-like protein (cupin superfamily)